MWVQALRYLFFSGVLLSLFQHVDYVTTSLRARFQVYLSQPLVLCIQAKAVQFNLLGVESHFWIFSLSLVDCLGRCNQYMWVVSCRRKRMLTQGPPPGPKYRLKTSSLFRFPHLSDCLVCIRNSMFIVLLQMVVGWDRGEVVYL